MNLMPKIFPYLLVGGDGWRSTLHLRHLLILLGMAFAVAACHEENHTPSGGSEGTGSDLSSEAPTITFGPVFTLAPNPNTPLAGLLELATDELTTVEVSIINGVNNQIILFQDFGINHSLPVLGFRPGHNYTIQVKVIDQTGAETTHGENIFVTTAPLPKDFPPIHVESTPENMEPGVTMFNVGGNGANSSFGTAIVIIDEVGEVVWYHRPGSGVSDVRRLSNGNIIFINTNTRANVTEIDMLGNITNEWHAALTVGGNPGSIPVFTESIHHEIFEMENGNLVVLSFELRFFENYWTSLIDPFAPRETAPVISDRIVEFTRDGTIVNNWSLFDIIDPYRVGYDALGGFWNSFFPELEGGTRDWSHGNAVIHDPADNTFIVSLRHQDAVVKFKRETGELVWILGTHANWDPEIYGPFLLNPVGEGFLWQYHQHAPMITPEGNILIFDNGNHRASPFDPGLPATENFSRAVEYRIDEENMQIEQVWEYGQFASEIIYTPFIGDADHLPLTGNVLVNFGGITLDSEGNPTNTVFRTKNSVRLVEVQRGETNEIVFEMSIEDTTGGPTDGWITYRAERLTGIYP